MFEREQVGVLAAAEVDRFDAVNGGRYDRHAREPLVRRPSRDDQFVLVESELDVLGELQSLAHALHDKLGMEGVVVLEVRGSQFVHAV